MNDIRQIISRYRAFLFDVDGTLIHTSAAVPGAAGAVAWVRASGRKLVFVTNNSMLAARELAAHLEQLGITARADEIVSTIDVTAKVLAGADPGAPVLVLGSPALKTALAAAGLSVRPTGEGVRCVVVGGDRSLDYQKLTEAVRAVLRGATFVATNRDGLMLDPTGVYPGGGAVVGAIVGAIGRDPDILVGKPSTLLFEEALERLRVPAGECAVVGDSLKTDIATARWCGMGAILVLNGVTTRDMVETSGIQPDFVLDSVADLAAS